MCDLRYIEDNAVLSFSNRKLGIPLLNDGPKRLAQLIGRSRAIDVLLFDHDIDAISAVDMGIAIGPVKNGTGKFKHFFVFQSRRVKNYFNLEFCFHLFSIRFCHENSCTFIIITTGGTLQ